MKKSPTKSHKLSRKDIGFIAQALTLASWVFRGAIRNVTAEYGFGPHGAWILVMIDNGQVVYPLDVTNFINVSRSVITEELARLTEMRFITYRKSNDDRRRVELALTQSGAKVSARVRDSLDALITDRFKAYSRDEVLQFARMLYDFVYAEPMSPEAQSEVGPNASGRRAASKSARRRPERPS